MKKNKSFYLLIIGILVGIFAFSGCTNHNNSDAKNIQQDTKDPTPEKFSVVESQEPTLTEVDWSNYFEGLSILCVTDELHFLQSQRCDPAFVFPALIHLFPHTGQFT